MRSDRLDTVEEVTEPASSEYFADSLPIDPDNASGADMAFKGGMCSSGTASSDFQADSLPPDHAGPVASSMTASITSNKEEVYSVSEIEITHTMVAWKKSERKGSTCF